MPTHADFDQLFNRITGEITSVGAEVDASMTRVRAGSLQQAEMDAEFQKLTAAHDTLKALVDRLAGE